MLLTINFVTGVGSAAFGLVCRFLVFLEGDVTMVKVMNIFDKGIRLAFLFIISGGVTFTSVRRKRQCDNTTRVGKKDGIFKRPHLTKPRKLRSQFIVIVMCPFIFITTLYLHSIFLYNLSHFV